MSDTDLKYYPTNSFELRKEIIIGGTVGVVSLLIVITLTLLVLKFALPDNLNGTAKVIFLGDVMLGRRMDKLFDPHNYDSSDPGERIDEKTVQKFRKQFPNSTVPYSYVWGDMLSYLSEGSLNIINLENTITTYSKQWPGKDVHFRMHPANIQTLFEANISFCHLANDNILDYMTTGLLDTIDNLQAAGIPFAGAGVNIMEATKPAIIDFAGLRMGIFSFVDSHPDWAALIDEAGFNYLNIETLSPNWYNELDSRVSTIKQQQGVDVVVFSIHWGSNWNWTPAPYYIDFAHHLVDECEIDLVYGHSAHNIQGIEVYKGKPIIYGTGDFVDDYGSFGANGVNTTYRNDLGFLYGVNIDRKTKKWVSLELVPINIGIYQVNKAFGDDLNWLKNKTAELSGSFGTNFTVDEEGIFFLDLTSSTI